MVMPQYLSLETEYPWIQYPKEEVRRIWLGRNITICVTYVFFCLTTRH